MVDSRQPRLLDRGRDLARPSSSGRPATCWSTRSSRPTRSGPAGPTGDGAGTVVHVMPKPGVTDPEAESAWRCLRDLGYAVVERPHDPDVPDRGAGRRPASPDPAGAGQRRRRAGRDRRAAVRPARPGTALRFRRVEVPIRGAGRRRARCDLSRSGQLCARASPR